MYGGYSIELLFKCCRNCKKIGAQTWMVVAIIVTEVLITLKFDWDTFTKPLPQHVALGWIVGLVGLALWTVWHFYLQRLLTHTEQRSNGHSDDKNMQTLSRLDKTSSKLSDNVKFRRNQKTNE
jgi:hypothetical protein